MAPIRTCDWITLPKVHIMLIIKHDTCAESSGLGRKLP
jgi:hypothetical protein